MTDLEKYNEIVRLMNGVLMNPPPNCIPIQSTSKKQVYRTLYEIQKIIGKHRFVGEMESEE